MFHSTYHIERSVLASVLNFEQHADKLNTSYFLHPFHRKLANGYNRLKELGEAIDFELLRAKFIKAGKWSMQEDNELVALMTMTTPFANTKMFELYYSQLRRAYFERADHRVSV